jgi:hypothetical protein
MVQGIHAVSINVDHTSLLESLKTGTRKPWQPSMQISQQTVIMATIRAGTLHFANSRGN